MTDELSTLLRDRAESAELLAPDLGAITSAGRRRVRRRRGAGVLAGAAALALVGGGYAVVTGGSSPEQRSEVATEPGIPTSGLTWTTGSTLHVGDQSVDLGHRVAAYVQTSSGYVFADPDGTVWSAHDGAVDAVGHASAQHPRLVGAADGHLVGWVDPSGDRPAFAVLDQQTGDVQTAPSAAGTTAEAEGRSSAVFEVLAGNTAFWRDAGGRSTTTILPADHGSAGMSFLTETRDDVGWNLLDGRTDVYVVADPDSGQVSVHQPDGSVVTLRHVYGDIAQLSPDTRWVNVDADQPAVFDTSTGAPVTLDVHAYFADGFRWLDDHTLAVTALPTKHSDYEMLTCTVPDGACTVVVPHLGNVYDENGDGGAGFQLPVGFSLGD